MYYSAAIIALTLLTTISKSQSLEAIQKQFPGEKAVLLNKAFEYTIAVKDGKPAVESREIEQIEYLNTSAAAYMGKFGFSHSDFQYLTGYEAFTRTAGEKKLKVSEFKTSTDKESFVFYDDVKETTFNFPSVEPGAIGNLEVSYQNKEPHLLSPFYFTSSVPVVNSELKLTVSNDVSVKYKLVGQDTANIAIKVENHGRNKVYVFQYKNCPADKSYPDAPGYAWYSPHVIFYIDSYNDEQGHRVSYLSGIEDLYKLSYGFIHDVNAKPNPQLKHIVDSLTANITSAELKAKTIYSWVQQNIKYVAFENGMEGFVPRDAGLVCSRRFGDCKDMASILTAMLNTAGVPAYFTWLGTRDLPYSFSQVPLPLVSNHMICTIKLNGKFIFLDGTDPSCVFGFPPAAIQDKEVMVALNEKEYKILKVPVIEKEKNVLADTTWLELTPGGIKGKIKKSLKGYFATNVYERLMYMNNNNIREDIKEEFERGSNKFNLDTFYVEKKQPANEITLHATFTLPDYAKKIGDEYYINLNLFKLYDDEQIDYPKRKIPIGYNFKSRKQYVTLLKIPEGYKVTYLPQSKTYQNAVWGFDLKYEQKGNFIILKQTFDNDNLMLTSNQFELWNKVLENLLPLYKETLSIAKN